MKLKVIKYKNYGCTMTGGEDTDDWKHMFYWSFYELNNGKVIVLNDTEYWENDKLIENDFDCTYGRNITYLRG